MTTFFDQKQDVIDIELTKYGEYLLSLGKFKPVYYSFFDNNVLYDPRYAGHSGSQNDFEGRIQNETPSMRTQHSFEGRGDQVLAYNAYIADHFLLREDQKVRFPSTVDKNFTALNAPLGHSDLSSEKTPAWDMKFYNNDMLSWSTHYTGSHAPQRIPQIEATIKYKTQIKSTELKPPQLEGDTPVYDEDGLLVVGGIYQPVESEPSLREDIFADGTFIDVVPDYVLLDLQEINSLYERENFDIEVYEIETTTLSNGTTKDNLIPMKFRKKPQPIVDNILVEAEEEQVVLDPSYVEYFFDIFVDGEIDNVTICKSLSTLKSKGVYVETEFKCPDIPSYSQTANIYAPEDIESAQCATDTGET